MQLTTGGQADGRASRRPTVPEQVSDPRGRAAVRTYLVDGPMDAAAVMAAWTRITQDGGPEPPYLRIEQSWGSWHRVSITAGALALDGTGADGLMTDLRRECGADEGGAAVPPPRRAGPGGHLAGSAGLSAVARRFGVRTATVAVAATAVACCRRSGRRETTVGLEVPADERRPGAEAWGEPIGTTVLVAVDERQEWAPYLRRVQEQMELAARKPSTAPGGPVVRVQRPAGWTASSGLRMCRLAAPGPEHISTTLAFDRYHVLDVIFPQLMGHAVEKDLHRVLDELLHCPSGSPVASPVLDADERRRVLTDWNDSARPYAPGLVHDLVAARCLDRPDAVAIVDGVHSVTYAGLDRRSDLWAARFRAAGVGPERRVGVHLRRDAEMIAVLLGVLKAGGTYVPLDPTYPRARLAQMSRDAGMIVLVTGDGGLDLPGVVIMAAGDPGSGWPADLRVAPSSMSAESGAYLLYTSGTTGLPKGVLITHANAVDLLHWCQEKFGDDLDRVLATTSISFDCSILEIFAPLASGGTVVLAPGALEVDWTRTARDVRLMHSVPSVMAELIRSATLPAALGSVLLGGEPPWPSLIADVYRNGRVRQVVNVYGPTETTSYATSAIVEEESRRVPPIGRPVANTQVYVIDRYRRAAAVGAEGELLVGGAGVARGYLGHPAHTADRFRPDPFGPRAGARVYCTGDLVRADPAGVFTFAGRLDDQVKVRGVRVEPAEVEQTILRHPTVREAAVVASAGGDSALRLVAHVVGSAVDAVSAAELREHLRDSLPPALVPDSIVVLDELPRTPNGKIDRALLAHADPARVAGGTVRPRDQMERTVAAAWTSALGTEVGVHDDFYAIGGHSLVALRVRAELGVALHVDLPFELFFTGTTIAAQAAAIRAELAGRQARDEHPPQAGSASMTPLSSNQRAVWARVTTDPHDPMLNLPLCVRIGGAINVSALAMALAEVVRRHESLRVTPDPAGTVVMHRAAPEPIALTLVDLTGLPPERRESTAIDLSFRGRTQVLDPASGRMVGAELIRLGATDHVLSVVLHQFAADVQSIKAFGDELVTLYMEAVASQPWAVPDPVPMQYPDWARHQEAWLRSGAGAEQRRYWRHRLAGLPVLELPSTLSRGASVDATADWTEFGVDRDVLERLAALGHEESATLYMTLLASFQLLLGALTGQSDIAVGSPMSGRLRPDQECAVGPFVTAVVMRGDLTGDPTFRGLLRRARRTALAAYARQEVPIAQVIEDLDEAVDRSRHPLYQAAFTLHYLDTVPPLPTGLVISDFPPCFTPRTTLDVDLSVSVLADGARCSFTYRTDVCTRSDVALLAAAFPAVLEAVAASPDYPILRIGSAELARLRPRREDEGHG